MNERRVDHSCKNVVSRFLCLAAFCYALGAGATTPEEYLQEAEEYLHKGELQAATDIHLEIYVQPTSPATKTGPSLQTCRYGSNLLSFCRLLGMAQPRQAETPHAIRVSRETWQGHSFF